MPLPRKRRWLLIFIWLIVFVNLAYFAVMRLNIKDRLVQKYLTNYLIKATGGEVSIGNLSFSDSYLLVENFRIYLPKTNLEIRAESLHADFHLNQLIFKHFQKKTLIDKIYINNPFVRYNFSLKEKEEKKTSGKSDSKRKLPDLSQYFQELQIENGKIDGSVDVGEFRIRDRFSNINGSLITSPEVTAFFNGTTSNAAPFSVMLDLTERSFNRLQVNIENYQPLDMYIIQIDTLQAEYDLSFTYDLGEMRVNAGVKNIYLEVADRIINADSLHISGNGDKMVIDFENPVVDGNSAELQATLYDVYSSEISVDALLQSSSVDISDFQPFIKGIARAQAHMTGKFTDFTIAADAWLDSVRFGKQIFTKADLSATVKNKEVLLKINNLEWQRNKVKAEGYYKYAGIAEFNAFSDTLHYQIGNIQLMGRVTAAFNREKESTSWLRMTDFSIFTPEFNLDCLEFTASLEDSLVNIEMHRHYNDLALKGTYDIYSSHFDLSLALTRFRLSQTLNIYTFPTASGTINCSGNPDSLSLDSNLRFYDQYFGMFDGRIKTTALLDFKNQRSFLELHTRNARYNYEDMQIDIIAAGNLDSISTSRCEVNNDINIDAVFFMKPVLGWNLHLRGNRLDLKDQLKYLVDYKSLDSFGGDIDLEISADSRGLGKFAADAIVTDLRFGELQNLDLTLELAGDNQRININKGIMRIAGNPTGNFSGCLQLQPEFGSNFQLKMTDFDIKNILPETGYRGVCEGIIGYNSSSKGNALSLQLTAKDLQTAGIKIDSIAIDLTQQDSLLIVSLFSALVDKNTTLSASGALGYNIFTENSYYSPEQIEVSFSGDLIKLLRKNIDYIRSGKSKSSIHLIATMNDNGLDIIEAEFLLKGSDLLLKDQIETIEKINIDCRITDNILNINELSARLGNGKLLIENSVGFNNEDLNLQLINLGQILISTTGNGIRFHLPQYSQKNSFISLALQGRNSHYMRFYQHDDKPLLVGNIVLNQAEILYPPNSENITKMLNSFTADMTKNWSVKKKDKTKIPSDAEQETEEYAPLPYNLDLYLVTGENVRYVTYPFQITFLPGSYAYLNYTDEIFSIPDANFISEEGRVELVGVFLDVDHIRVSYNQKLNNVALEAVFIRKVADGTQIQLLITDEGEGNFPNNLQMALSSDNTYDLTDTEKLFRLRYGRGLDELSAVERNNLMQNDLIQTAGGEIENIIIDPVINKLELFISRKLNIDYFQMETSFIYNLLSGNSDLYGAQEDYANKYSADILLENLSFKAGRYIFNDLLLNYQITFQRIYDADLQTGMGVYHTLSFRYDMPMDIKFLYEYNIDPWERDSHEYSFNRTIRFNDFTDLYYKLLYPGNWQEKTANRFIRK
ncbi:MAG: hypothetical protein K9N06_08450 [Candidatus Cloacimonetes bacterium]|nr:hypothetical protein [Candidatus Cloacimonadota bacterium]